jgi:hypothetical protein
LLRADDCTQESAAFAVMNGETRGGIPIAVSDRVKISHSLPHWKATCANTRIRSPAWARGRPSTCSVAAPAAMF